MAITTVDVIGRYMFNWPLRGAFEITELLLLMLIFAGLPLVSQADEHVTLDFIDPCSGIDAAEFSDGWWMLFAVSSSSAWHGGSSSRPARYPVMATPPMSCSYPVGPFVYFMALMIVVTGIVQSCKAFLPAHPSPKCSVPTK